MKYKFYLTRFTHPYNQTLPDESSWTQEASDDKEARAIAARANGDELNPYGGACTFEPLDALLARRAADIALLKTQAESDIWINPLVRKWAKARKVTGRGNIGLRRRRTAKLRDEGPQGQTAQKMRDEINNLAT